MVPCILGRSTPQDDHPSSRRPEPRTRVPERQSTPEPINLFGLSLRELEVSLDKSENELELLMERAKKHVDPDGSKEATFIQVMIGHTKTDIKQTKMMIQRVDPGSERLRNSGTSNPYLPRQAGRAHQESGSRHGRRGPAPLKGHGYYEDHGYHGDHG